MKYLQALNRLCVALVLSALIMCDASARSLTKKPVPFFLCSANVKSIILTKVPGSETNWEFVITLNGMGAQQFRELEEVASGRLVDIIWAGVSFGKRRLDIPVPPDAKRLVLGSNWFSASAAHATFDLLNKNLLQKRNLNSPCGAA
jgi:hypothetical protein